MYFYKMDLLVNSDVSDHDILFKILDFINFNTNYCGLCYSISKKTETLGEVEGIDLNEIFFDDGRSIIHSYFETSVISDYCYEFVADYYFETGIKGMAINLFLLSPLPVRVKFYGASYEKNNYGRYSYIEPRLVFEIPDISSELLRPFYQKTIKKDLSDHFFDNEIHLMCFSREIVEFFSPESCKIFFSRDFNFAINSVFAYYRNLLNLKNEILFMIDLINNGIPDYNIPPIKKWDNNEGGIISQFQSIEKIDLIYSKLKSYADVIDTKQHHHFFAEILEEKYSFKEGMPISIDRRDDQVFISDFYIGIFDFVKNRIANS